MRHLPKLFAGVVEKHVTQQEKLLLFPFQEHELSIEYNHSTMTLVNIAFLLAMCMQDSILYNIIESVRHNTTVYM